MTKRRKTRTTLGQQFVAEAIEIKVIAAPECGPCITCRTVHRRYGLANWQVEGVQPYIGPFLRRVCDECVKVWQRKVRQSGDA